MKLLVAFLAFAVLLVAEGSEGNYKIRFEPTAKLQTGAEIPFLIKVADSRSQPLSAAKVHVTCRLTDDTSTEVQADAHLTTAGAYIAKPVFPKTGTWDVIVEVTWNDKTSSRDIQFNVAE